MQSFQDGAAEARVGGLELTGHAAEWLPDCSVAEHGAEICTTAVAQRWL